MKKIFSPFFGASGLILILVWVGFSLLDQSLTKEIESEISNPNGTGALLWVYAGLSLLAGLVGPVITGFLAICTWKFPDTPLPVLASKHLSYLVREEMRVFGQSLLWSLAFVLPGVIRFLQLTFVPFVVLLDPKYQAGEVDALTASRKRFQKKWLSLLRIYLLFGLIFPLLMTSFDEWRSFFEHPLTALLFVPVEIAVLLVFQYLLLQSWEKANESDVSMV